ncbi:hypothetical protein PAL_GLEAN10024794 [Pteropus alecto]|uniref:Uncharacterized protein n=1 Tax=Pteropus alecto TaxID=9402 RepID=L5K1T2_PTEAL|nr:hypothetical protein PAL_GLEAN10024794 [Pteropus alecto]
MKKVNREVVRVCDLCLGGGGRRARVAGSPGCRRCPACPLTGFEVAPVRHDLKRGCCEFCSVESSSRRPLGVLDGAGPL